MLIRRDILPTRGVESPLTPALSPLTKGGEGAGSGGILSAEKHRSLRQVNSSSVPLSGGRMEG
jgi:hypothetical protein